MKTPIEAWTCNEKHNGLRLDQFACECLPEASRSQVQKWIEAACFELNGNSAKKNIRLKEGDVLSLVTEPETPPSHIEPEDIPLVIIYEDEHLIVVDKPKGISVHPGNGIYRGTLANALMYHCKNLSDVGGVLRPGIVHRLDKDTSGLLICAKDNRSHALLSHMLAERSIRRVYNALVWGRLDGEGEINQPIGRDSQIPTRMTVTPTGKPALTLYRSLRATDHASHVELRLQTGRTHQIRVHLRYIGRPVVGDKSYGPLHPMRNLDPVLRTKARPIEILFESQALHACHLEFQHPITQKQMELDSPLPPPMKQAIELLS